MDLKKELLDFFDYCVDNYCDNNLGETWIIDRYLIERIKTSKQINIDWEERCQIIAKQKIELQKQVNELIDKLIKAGLKKQAIVFDVTKSD